MSKGSSVSVCPVPEEQQPLNEFKELQESWFFRWGTLELAGYMQPILWVWGISWLICAPAAAASFAPAKHPISFLLSSCMGASALLSLPLIQLYLGWNYVQQRLLSPVVTYEESGWYDGQAWQKTPEAWTRDRLVAAHEIQPILKRTGKTLCLLGAGLLVGAALWYFQPAGA